MGYSTDCSSYTATVSLLNIKETVDSTKLRFTLTTLKRNRLYRYTDGQNILFDNMIDKFDILIGLLNHFY